MDDCAVLIVNWNTPSDLERCLRTFRDHEGWDVPLGVHQNHSSDKTDAESVEIAEKYEAHRITQSKNLGHGAGINIISKKFDTDYLFLVNPDCAWKEPVINRLIMFLEAEPTAAIVGPKQMDSQNRITAAGIVGTLAAPQHRHWHAHDPQNRLARDIVQSTVVAGSALMISNQDFSDFGGLLEAKHYFSETWLCYHVQAHDRTCWYYGEPWMIHDWHRSSPQGDPMTDGKIKEDQALFRHMCDTHDPPIPHD